jgi:methylated-DNA-[protein]-cysteine S-methyltransferase
MSEPAQVFYSHCSSPVGELLLTSSDGKLTGLYMALHRGGAAPEPKPEWGRDDPVLRLAREQLNAFFGGRLRAFDLPLQMMGTPFQKQVWEGLLTIPYGTTISYAELARRIGRPGASRAVGAANGRNPIGIIVPCHRVIGADGTLTGYGGGLPRKEWLISHEASVLDRRANLHLVAGANTLDIGVTRHGPA